MAKFNVNFSDSTHAAVVELSERMDVPMADVIREALSLLWWLARESMAGNRILIQRGDQVTELMIPSLEALRDVARPHGRREGREVKPERQGQEPAAIKEEQPTPALVAPRRGKRAIASDKGS